MYVGLACDRIPFIEKVNAGCNFCVRTSIGNFEPFLHTYAPSACHSSTYPLRKCAVSDGHYLLQCPRLHPAGGSQLAARRSGKHRRPRRPGWGRQAALPAVHPFRLRPHHRLRTLPRRHYPGFGSIHYPSRPRKTTTSPARTPSLTPSSNKPLRATALRCNWAPTSGFSTKPQATTAMGSWLSCPPKASSSWAIT